MVREVVIVGPHDDGRGMLKESWCWVYFHGDAELLNSAYCAKQGNGTPPDLVMSDTPLASLDDGFCLIRHVNGQGLFLHLWSYDPEWRNGKSFVRRHGLIVHPDDQEADDYAEKCRKEKRNHL